MMEFCNEGRSKQSSLRSEEIHRGGRSRKLRCQTRRFFALLPQSARCKKSFISPWVAWVIKVLLCLRLTVGAVDFAGEITACAVPYALVTFAICDYGACRSFSGTPARGAK